MLLARRSRYSPLPNQRAAGTVLRRGSIRQNARLSLEMRMKSGLLIVVGTVITVAGIVFALQGLGYIGGSVMSGVTFWAVAGPLIALTGIVLAVFGVRYRRSSS